MGEVLQECQEEIKGLFCGRFVLAIHGTFTKEDLEDVGGLDEAPEARIRAGTTERLKVIDNQGLDETVSTE